MLRRSMLVPFNALVCYFLPLHKLLQIMQKECVNNHCKILKLLGVVMCFRLSEFYLVCEKKVLFTILWDDSFVFYKRHLGMRRVLFPEGFYPTVIHGSYYFHPSWADGCGGRVDGWAGGWRLPLYLG